MLWVLTIEDGCRSDSHFWWQVSDSSNTRVYVELHYLRCYVIGLNKTQRKHPWPTPLDGSPCVRLGWFIEPTPQGGQTAHHGGDVCCWVLLIVDGTFYYSYCWNPTGWEFFILARKCFVTTRTQIGFKLLRCMARTTQPMSMAVYMMVGSNNDQDNIINVNVVVVASVQQGWCWKRAQKPTPTPAWPRRCIVRQYEPWSLSGPERGSP